MCYIMKSDSSQSKANSVPSDTSQQEYEVLLWSHKAWWKSHPSQLHKAQCTTACASSRGIQSHLLCVQTQPSNRLQSPFCVQPEEWQSQPSAVLGCFWFSFSEFGKIKPKLGCTCKLVPSTCHQFPPLTLPSHGVRDEDVSPSSQVGNLLLYELQ